VVLYALLCGTLPFDDEHVTTLFRKIKSGVFPIPDYLNKSVVSLLCHMLQTDPMKRATVEDIRKHEWFTKDCPKYLFPDRVTDTSIVDTDAIAEVSQKFGVEEQEIHSALLSDDPHNQLVIAYNLIIDNKRIQTAKEEDDFKEFFSGSPSSLGQDSMTARPHPERILAPLRDKPVTPVTAKTHRGAPIKRSKWQLGIHLLKLDGLSPSPGYLGIIVSISFGRLFLLTLVLLLFLLLRLLLFTLPHLLGMLDLRVILEQPKL